MTETSADIKKYRRETRMNNESNEVKGETNKERKDERDKHSKEE